MNVLLGLAIVAVALALTCAGVGGFTDRDALVFAGLGICGGVLVLGLLGFGVFVALGGDTGPSLREGACYRAYGKESYMPVTTTAGKVTTTTIVPMHSVDLAEITCP